MSDFSNPYESPRAPAELPVFSDSAPNNVWAQRSRLMAAVLAVSTTLLLVWGMVSFSVPEDLGWLVVFPPGGVLACGYYWRAIVSPSLTCRRFVWGYSFLAQVVSLAWAVERLLAISVDGTVVFLALCFAASAIMSLLGLLLDAGE